MDEIEETNPFLEPIETLLKDTDEIKNVLKDRGIKHQINIEFLFDDVKLHTKVKVSIDC